MTPDEIAALIKEVETKLPRMAKKARRGADGFDWFSTDNKISEFKAAAGKAAMNRVVGHLGAAIGDLHIAHVEAMKFDPRPKPEDGDGK